METVLLAVLSVAVGALIGHFWPEKPASDPADTSASPLDALTEAISVLDERVETLEKSEAIREAMVADALDRFGRLYKRTAERQSREDRAGSTNDPPAMSDLEARQRFGRRVI